MRTMLIAATTAAATLALGASSAFALPPNSPYAIYVPQSVDQGTASGGGYVDQAPGAMTEGRSAFVDRAPSAAPDIAVPQSPSWEDYTYYSRGR